MSSLATSIAKDQPVTAIALDGNCVSAATVSYPNGITHVHAVSSFELDGFVERVEREMHPIFMDVDYLSYPNSQLVEITLNRVLEDPDMNHPVVGVFPSDCIKYHRENGEKHDQEGRRARAFATFQSANPYVYPRLLTIDEIQEEDGTETIQAASGRFEDVIASVEQYRRGKKPFLGLISGKRAISEVSLLLDEFHQKRPVNLVEIGTLRSIYAGAYNGHIEFLHAIPVGLARDDVHYFSAIKPVMKNLVEMHDELGSLLFPPEVTPSPIFDPTVSTPQVDCTRFATQIARFANRVIYDIWENQKFPETIPFYIAGRPASLPGLNDYITVKTGADVHSVSDVELPHMELADGISWKDVSEHLTAIGAGIAFHRRDESRLGSLIFDRRPKTMTSEDVQNMTFVPGEIYVMEHPEHISPLAKNRFPKRGGDHTPIPI